MTYTVAQIVASESARHISGVIATLHHVEKGGVRRTFLNASFTNEEGDPAYLAIGTPPKRGPVFARTAKEGELQLMLKPIKVMNGGTMPAASTVMGMEGISVGSLIENLTDIGFSTGHSQIAALTLAGLLSLDTCAKLFASFTMLNVLQLDWDKETGQSHIVTEDLVVERKRRKKLVSAAVEALNETVIQTAASIAKSSEAVKAFSKAAETVADDLDEDEMLLLGAG